MLVGLKLPAERAAAWRSVRPEALRVSRSTRPTWTLSESRGMAGSSAITPPVRDNPLSRAYGPPQIGRSGNRRRFPTSASGARRVPGDRALRACPMRRTSRFVYLHPINVSRRGFLIWCEVLTNTRSTVKFPGPAILRSRSKVRVTTAFVLQGSLDNGRGPRQDSCPLGKFGRPGGYDI
jgi:hypothetical protein